MYYWAVLCEAGRFWFKWVWAEALALIIPQALYWGLLPSLGPYIAGQGFAASEVGPVRYSLTILGISLAIVLLVGLIRAPWALAGKASARETAIRDERDSLSAIVDTKSERKRIRNELSALMQRGHELIKRSRATKDQQEVIPDANAWIEEATAYARTNIDDAHAVLLNDGTGYTFGVDGSEGVRVRNAIDLRLRRIIEFIKELAD